MEEPRRVLIVEDDTELAELLSLHLREDGFAAERAASGPEGLRKAREGGFVLVILDIMLPGANGIEVCRRLREGERHVPVLMLTAKSEETDKVVGLEVGADDYVTKPFGIRELMARVRALTRRYREMDGSGEEDGEGEVLEYGPLRVDIGRRRVTLRGRRVDLTAKEFELLVLLARHPEQAFSRDRLLDRVWGYSHAGYGHTVNSHINRLRSKIEEDHSQPRFVRTVWGYGYRFTPPEEE
jgi:DNA-binding response OmpR family regulator